LAQTKNKIEPSLFAVSSEQIKNLFGSYKSSYNAGKFRILVVVGSAVFK